MLQIPSTTGATPWISRNNALLGAILFAAAATMTGCKPGAPAPASESNVPAANGADTKPQPDATATPAAAATPASAADALIGKIVPPYPEGLDEVQGNCVPGGAGLDHACDFGLAVLGNAVDGAAPASRFIIASSNADTAAELPRWQVSDAIDAPDVDAGYSLQIAGCRVDRAGGEGIVAVVRHTDAEYSSDVTWARRFDTGTGKFSEIPVAQVDCVNPGYGV